MNTHRECETLEHTALNGMCSSNPHRAQGIPKKRRQKKCRSQRGWRTSEEQVHLYQLNNIHIKSPRLKQQAQGLNSSAPGPLYV